MGYSDRKQEYFARLKVLISTYNKILLVGANNVGSNQLQMIRIALRGKAVVMFGKNTMIRKIIKEYLAEHPGHAIQNLVPYVEGNIGFIFTNGDIGMIRQVIEENRVPAAAKTGALAECDVVIPPGPTGCDPGQTSWFQALNVPTKITKGQIEIVSELRLVVKGERVGASEAGLLQKLDIRPFTYGLKLQSIYDNGAVFDAKVLDITSEALTMKFIENARKLAAISLQIGYPTLVSLPHSIGKRARDLLAICAMTDFKFKYSEPWDKLFNMDPEELAKMQAAQAAASSSGGEGGAEAPKEEVVEEEEIDMGGGGDLFGGDEGGAY